MTEEFGQMARYFEDTEQGAGVGLVPPTAAILPPPTAEDCRVDGRLDKTQSNPRHFDQFPRLRCAAAITNYHSTFGDVDDRPGTHPLHHFGQPGVDWSKTPVRLCETRETREPRPVDCPALSICRL